VLWAAGVTTPDKGAAVGVAFGALTLCAALHISSRRGGIAINNAFAVVKCLMLVVMIALGFAKAGGAFANTGEPKATTNFDTASSFKVTGVTDVGSCIDAFLYVIYTYSGYDQPFYVLSEVRTPRKVFPTYTILAVVLLWILKVLLNVAYLCAVPSTYYTNGGANLPIMATVFFANIFGNEGAERAMSGLIAVSIFGNLLVMTFTAARVKQEIAKEGILPFSLFFATGHTTPLEWLKASWRGNTKSKADPNRMNDHLEQAPMAALGLHWFTSVLLVSVTSMLQSSTAYSFLVSLYSYVVIILPSFLSAAGLLYLKLSKQRNWRNLCNFKPWLDPLHAVLTFIIMGFFLFASFAKPGAVILHNILSYPWYLVPTIGLSSLLWGMVWWLGLKGSMRYRQKSLVVHRTPFIVQDEEDEGQWVQKAEIVDHEWIAWGRPADVNLDNYRMD